MRSEQAEVELILYLSALQNRGNEYQRPYEVTLNGIKQNCGLSQSMTSRVLIRLCDTGLVDTEQAHPVKDGTVLKQKLKCFKLSPSGMRAAREYKERGVARMGQIVAEASE